MRSAILFLDSLNLYADDRETVFFREGLLPVDWLSIISLVSSVTAIGIQERGWAGDTVEATGRAVTPGGMLRAEGEKAN